MGPVVVADQVHLAFGIAARQRIEGLEELLVAMTPIAMSVHLARATSSAANRLVVPWRL